MPPIYKFGAPESAPNAHLCSVIIQANIANVKGASPNTESRCELDSHANMVVIGGNAAVVNKTGLTAQVSPFTPDYEALTEVPIVDAVITYDCPYTDKSVMMVFRNALHVPAMEHHLVPPFILREAGIVVNEAPKIQVENPSIDDHSIYFPNDSSRIPLSLWGIFSYFPCRCPTNLELNECNNVQLMTPDGSRWNPHSDVYARNEENMLDWEGQLVEKKDRVRILIEDIDVGSMDGNCYDTQISAIEVSLIDLHVDSSPVIGDRLGMNEGDKVPSYLAEASTVLNEVSPTLDPVAFADALIENATIGHISSAMGSTAPFLNDILFDDDDLCGKQQDEEIDMDAFFSSSSTTASQPKGITAEKLSKVWKIDLEEAKKTVKVTTQHRKHSDNPNLTRNYSTNDRMLRYRRINRHFFMDTFFAAAKAGKSTRGHTCMQLFVTDKGFVYVVPMASKKDVPLALKLFAKEIGAPDAIIADASGEQTSKEVKAFLGSIGTSLRLIEEGTPWANRAELYIGLLKSAIRKDMKGSNCPLALWDYCAERRARINNLTARDLFQLDGNNAHFDVMGEEGDISNLCRFDWYEWCYFLDQKAGFPLQREILGRVLGPSKGVGNEMSQWILKSNGKIVARRTVRPLTAKEHADDEEKVRRKAFTDIIDSIFGTFVTPMPEPTKDSEFVEYEDDDEEARVIPEWDDPVDSAGNPIDQQPLYDKLINAELLLQHGDNMVNAKIIGRSIGSDGHAYGTYDENPVMNTMVYDIEFPDGEVKEYSANVIAENMYAQVDDEGYITRMYDTIIDWSKDQEAVTTDNCYTTTKSGNRRYRKTTVGWKLLVLWKDGSEQWIPLKDMKESHPIEVAEFAKAVGIDHEPGFAWWVPYTLRKRDVIIAAVKHRIRRTTHKYGIEVPVDLAHAQRLDKLNGNDLWVQALKKEMKDVGMAFKILDHGEHAPVGYTKASGHLIWDVKMDFTRKARWVLDGHKTEAPNISTYAGVVSRESVRIALTYAALNGVDICAADIRNAYLQAPSSQKHFVICGAEFGLENVGKKALILRALYGGKSAGRDFRNHLRECMSHLGFKPCLADPDVWMRSATKSDGSDYWEYVLLYVDDALCISENPERVLRDEVGKYFELKEASIGPPDIYLGGRMRKVTMVNGAQAWAFGSSQYVQAAVKNVEDHLKTSSKSLPHGRSCETPLSSNYRPELDISPELKGADAAYYQSLIGVLRWMVELGRVDICCEVSMMSSHLALPRDGHLEQVYHIFGYLKKYHNSEMVFDPSDPTIDEESFERRDWTSSEFGLNLTEEMPTNMPESRGLGFVMRAYVDADHASNTITRRSRTGFLVYLNMAPVYWLSKKQTSVETSSFGSEFTAMKQCTEYLRGLRYKLRMMGIPCSGPSFIYGDNQSVLSNTAVPDSTLKKKSQSIAYHFVREGCARDEWRITYVNTHLNPADLLTKPLPSGKKRASFVQMILHHLMASVDYVFAR